MNIIRANNDDVGTIHHIVHTTMNIVYPRYYPEHVVQFFLNHHSIDSIEKAIGLECILLLECEGKIIGTGALRENEIRRMFILPEYQGKGYGCLLLDKLEQQAMSRDYTTVVLDSSLPAYNLYVKRGYTPIKYETIVVRNGQVLCFHTMSKELHRPEYLIDYNNRMFTSICNSNNGEVSDKTIFKYKQQNDIIWAEYFGGEIIRGYLIGTTDNEGKLEFCYQHINIKKEVRTGKCKSVPQILPDGRIRLLEEWEWTNGDKTKGTSVIEEIKG